MRRQSREVGRAFIMSESLAFAIARFARWIFLSIIYLPRSPTGFMLPPYAGFRKVSPR
jgi:hypothetical protein